MIIAHLHYAIASAAVTDNSESPPSECDWNFIVNDASPSERRRVTAALNSQSADQIGQWARALHVAHVGGLQSIFTARRFASAVLL